MSESYPILEFDPSKEAMIEPSKIVQPKDVPEHCVISFFGEVVEAVAMSGKKIHTFYSEAGLSPLYEIEIEGKRLAFFRPGIGAPFASAMLEEAIAIGCRKFIACGGCGVLDSDIPVGHVIVPSAAVRDEGTSYHYLPPSRHVAASTLGVEAIKQTLTDHNIEHTVGKTWTTDGVYRETPDKIKRRKAEGCITVEMEAAAFFAVAQFRKVTFAQLLYGGDDVGGKEWDSRNWLSQKSTREKLFWLAAEACLKLA